MEILIHMNREGVKRSGHRFAPAERRLIRRLRTPSDVQRYLNHLPYNTEPAGDTLRTFRQVARRGTAHCLEAALFAACVLEQHGYPPLLMGLESVDLLDHVIFVYSHRGRWGSVARSRDLDGERRTERRARTGRQWERVDDVPAGCVARPGWAGRALVLPAGWAALMDVSGRRSGRSDAGIRSDGFGMSTLVACAWVSPFRT